MSRSRIWITPRSNYDGALAALDSLRAQVKQMEVALAQAETNLAYSYIRAPFAGYVAERNLDSRLLCQRGHRQHLHHVARDSEPP